MSKKKSTSGASAVFTASPPSAREPLSSFPCCALLRLGKPSPSSPPLPRRSPPPLLASRHRRFDGRPFLASPPTEAEAQTSSPLDPRQRTRDTRPRWRALQRISPPPAGQDAESERAPASTTCSGGLGVPRGSPCVTSTTCSGVDSHLSSPRRPRLGFFFQDINVASPFTGVLTLLTSLLSVQGQWHHCSHCIGIIFSELWHQRN